MMWRAFAIVALMVAACRVEPRQSTPPKPTASEPLPVGSAGANPVGPTALASSSADGEVEPISESPAPSTDAEPTPAPEPEYPFQLVDVLKRPVARDAPASRNANLSPAACARELRAKKYPFKRVGAFKGIATPVRVDGEIEGVKFRVPGAKSQFGVLDCRLALTLVEFARFLAAQGVTQVTVDNFYRPNARLPSSRSKRSQHAYGLAIDLTTFTLADGRVLHVENDWGAGIETEPCGPGAQVLTPTSNTVELRELVCKLVQQQIFHHHLTPSYDRAHRNHLHLDVKRDEHSVTAR